MNASHGEKIAMLPNSIDHNYIENHHEKCKGVANFKKKTINLMHSCRGKMQDNKEFPPA